MQTTAEMDELTAKYQFGQDDDLQQKNGSTFNGRRTFQHKDFSFSGSMADYIEGKLHEVPLDKLRKKQPTDGVTEPERQQLRGLVQCAMWLARQNRPDVIGPAALMARRICDATVADIIEMNKVVAHCKGSKDMTLKLPAIKPEDLIWVAIADAANNTAGETHSQGATIGAVSHRRLGQGLEAPLGMLAWRSGKSREFVTPLWQQNPTLWLQPRRRRSG